MRKCVFCNCPYKKGSKLSFHRFPTDLKERSKWLENMKLSNWTPQNKDYLCSKHFDAQCFVKHDTRSTLKVNSIPTIFEGQHSNEELEIADCNDEASVGKEMDVEEPQPAVVVVLTYPYKQDKSTTVKFKTDKQDGTINYQNYQAFGTPDKSKIEYGLAHDHQYSSRSSKKTVQRIKQSLKLSHSRVKALKQRVKRLKAKVAYLKAVINGS